jgi:hypothetical protein
MWQRGSYQEELPKPRWNGGNRGNGGNGGNRGNAGNGWNNGNGNGDGDGDGGNGNAGGNRKRNQAFVMNAGQAINEGNVLTGWFPVNDCYAFVLFDSRADKSFISHKFSKLLNVEALPLDNRYIVELADGKLIEASPILKDCQIKLSGRKISIDLHPIVIGSFDVVVGMDWLSKN